MPALFTKGDTTFDAIYAHYIDPEKYTLTAKQEAIRIRWAMALTLRSNYLSKMQAAQKIMEEYGVGLSQAYNDVSNSERLFGNFVKSEREGRRAILQEWAEKLFQRALHAKDLKIQAKALELIARFAGVDDDSEAQFNPEKFENKEIVIKVDANIEDAFIEALKKGAVNFNKVSAEDAEFIEID